MNTSSKEIIDAQYHCRHLQVQGIKTQAEELFNDENQTHPEQVKALKMVTMTPKSFQMFDRYPGGKMVLFENAAQALEIVARQCRVMSILGHLDRITDQENRRLTELAIDFEDTSHTDIIRVSGENLHIAVTLANMMKCFKEYFGIATTAVTQGKTNAWKNILSLVQQESKPLMRLRKDMAERLGIKLTTPVGGGLVGGLPTKVDRVELRYFYPQGENLPKLSLVVRPFESE